MTEAKREDAMFMKVGYLSVDGDNCGVNTRDENHASVGDDAWSCTWSST